MAPRISAAGRARARATEPAWVPDDPLFDVFRHLRFRSLSLYDAPEWYDFEYGPYVGERVFYERAAAAYVSPDEAYVELGAGTGRLSVPMARRGHRVHGVEPAAAMRARLLQRLHKEPGLTDAAGAGRHTLEGSTAQRFRGPQDAAMALVAFPFNGILHLHTRIAMRRAFAHVHRLLLERGTRQARFALDMTAPSWEVMAQQELPWGRVDERPHPRSGQRVFSCDRAGFCPRSRVLTTVTRFVSEGERMGVEVTLRQTMWTYQEVQALLGDVGFHIEECLGDVDFSPWRERSPRMLVIARPVAP